ncbi:MAG: nucleotidyltransferase family protein [Clostridiales bacterium]|nr:nucleotidyltransferase family protein [Clostridiales bacterium]
MNTTGIVAEYNPLHNGHLRLIRKIREDLGEDTPVVVIMSGEFVQRGIPALTDRTSRVCALLSCGVDVVLELPFTFATGSADRFAHGAVSSLIRSGVITDLYFGAEHDSLSDLSSIAKIDFESDPSFSETLDSCQKSGLSYAASWEQAASSVMASHASGSSSISPEAFGRIIHEPNNILAVAYLRELDRAGSSIVPHLLLREDPYHEESLKESAFPSATALRKQILTSYSTLSSGDFISSVSELLPHMPIPMLAEMLHLWNSGTIPMGEKELISSSIPLIRSLDLPHLSSVAHMGPQLAGHLKSTVRSMHFDPEKDIAISFREAVETRCFSYTRILRALSSLVIGQTAEDLSLLTAPCYLRLLGFSEKGRTVLKTMRSNSKIPILSRASDAFHFGKDPVFSRMDELDRLSHDWWTMKARNTFEEDFKREVIQFKRNRLYRS